MIGVLILAAAQCAATPDAYETLAEKYGETRAMIGLSQTGAVLEIWTGPDGAWTALITRPDGTSCMVDAGQGMQAVAQGEPA